jgi:predicted ATPase/class 3 adenylate cyclase
MPSEPLPGGTVTFLFSDIEGSTRIEQATGTARYAELRERHREILRAAFAAHGGIEQGTEGDSFFVVFRSAREAVAAAVEGQRAIVEEPWPDDAAIRVRMGLHSGEAGLAGGSLVGIDINRAARIAAVANGGQILISDATRALVGGEVAGDLYLRDLGEHRLRDLAAPERLTQVDADGLPSEFRVLRSLDARPNNLPTQLTTFVGRERELGEAQEALARTRLLTMTGPGGTGKTRLSLQLAAAAADGFPDGVWFVALEPVRDPELVAPTIARVLGAASSSTRTPIDLLAELIGETRQLIVLDNFEQVIAGAPVVAELLRRCANVTVLVTSRAPLRVSGEQEFPVPGLPTPPDVSQLSEIERLNLPLALREPDAASLSQYEAVRLFIARAVAVRPAFAVTNANAPAVAQICARLHGMPLAIELAAARIKLLSPEQILARLEDHLALLTAGSRDLPERQQTLRGAIAWSYDLLEEGPRRLVDRLSVFRGGCDLETAETVCGPASDVGGDVLDGLTGLVDHSLVRVDDMSAEPRFVMLESIREFAAEQLDLRGETDVLRERHANAMVDLAERAQPHLTGVDQRMWLDRLERDHDNLRAVLDWTTTRPSPELGARLVYSLWRFWQQRGYLIEARARLEAMAKQDWDLEPVERARFAEAFGGIVYWQSDRDAATHWYDVALSVWRDLDDKRELANALYNRAYADVIGLMGGLALDTELFERTKAMLMDALKLYEELGDKAGEGNIIWGLGTFHYYSRDIDTARTWYQRSLALHRASGSRTMEAWSLHMGALVDIADRRFEEGGRTAKEALQVFADSGDVAGITLELDNLASVAAAGGDLVRGGRLWGAARHLQQLTGTGLADYVEETHEMFDTPTPRLLLTPEDLAARAAEGAAMSLDDVVAYALEETEGDAHADTPGAQPAGSPTS